jgi:hypothetical protein
MTTWVIVIILSLMQRTAIWQKDWTFRDSTGGLSQRQLYGGSLCGLL